MIYDISVSLLHRGNPPVLHQGPFPLPARLPYHISFPVENERRVAFRDSVSGNMTNAGFLNGGRNLKKLTTSK
jgi:hypothetical protein